MHPPIIMQSTKCAASYRSCYSCKIRNECWKLSALVFYRTDTIRCTYRYTCVFAYYTAPVVFNYHSVHASAQVRSQPRHPRKSCLTWRCSQHSASAKVLAQPHHTHALGRRRCSHLSAAGRFRATSEAWHARPLLLLALGLQRESLRPLFVRGLLLRWRLHVGVAREGARMKDLQSLLEV